MKGNWQTLWKLAVVAVLAVIATGFFISRLSRLRQSGEEGAKVWFYDQSAGRLYEAGVDTIPPDKGITGHAQDGVKAVVICFRAEQSDPRKRRVAYLETYGPELKALLEQVQAARRNGRTLKQQLPPRESLFFQTNNFVKRVEESEWHATSSPEGRKIMAEWRSWRGANGETPVVCVP